MFFLAGHWQPIHGEVQEEQNFDLPHNLPPLACDSCAESWPNLFKMQDVVVKWRLLSPNPKISFDTLEYDAHQS